MNAITEHWKVCAVLKLSGNLVSGQFWTASYVLTPRHLCWRRGDPRAPANQARYASIEHTSLPLAESLLQTLNRVQPLWQDIILPEIRQGKQLLIVSHKNLLKTLAMQLEELTSWQAIRLHIATGKPLCYDLNNQLKPIRRYYLTTPDNQSFRT